MPYNKREPGDRTGVHARGEDEEEDEADEGDEGSPRPSACFAARYLRSKCISATATCFSVSHCGGHFIKGLRIIMIIIGTQGPFEMNRLNSSERR